MDKKYEEFVNRIMNMRRFGKKRGVEVSTELLDAFNRPEKGMRVIHIAGTNGKGSTAVLIADMLMKMGFKAGLFTSPHLEDFNERIQVGEGDTFTRISHEEVLSIGSEILDKDIESEPTMFDICFIMAILKFKREQCDYVILETGLGGKYDSTTAISCIPKACVITSIALEHTEYLGDTVVDIAHNKAGIIKQGTKVVLSDIDKDAQSVILEECDKKGIKNSDVYRINDCNFDNCTYLKMLLGYQKKNAKTAIRTVQCLVDDDRDMFITKYMEYCKSGEEHCGSDCAKCSTPEKICELSFDEWVITSINRAIHTFNHAGRLEKAADNVILDGAHNVEAFTALYDFLESEYEGCNIHFIVGVMADKNYMEELKIISPIADEIMCADIDDERAKPGEELKAELTKEGIKAEYLGDEESVARFIFDLIKKNNAKSSPELYNNLYVICGSLYFVGNVKRLLWRLQQE